MNKGSRSLKTREQLVAITAILLIIITASAAYVYQTDPWIKENIQLIQAKRKLDAPRTAEYLGKHTYNISNQPNTFYTWKNQTTLYEAQITPEGSIKTHTYKLKPDEHNATMSPYTAQAIAEQLLVEATRQLPERFTIPDPTYTYSDDYLDQGGTWRIRWGLRLEDYPILGADFSVRVSTETGKAKIYHNSFNRTIDLTSPSPPVITEDQAIEIATESYLKSLDYPVVQSANARELGISMPGNVEIPPNALVWVIVVNGMGYENSNMVHRTTICSIDAHTGENYVGISVGGGAMWSMGSYPYYGSAYPLTTLCSPHGYEFPVTLEEAKGLIIRYALEGLPQGVAWENIILTLVDESQPLIVSFWVRAYDEFKTGTLDPPNSLRELEHDKQILDGYMIIVDPLNGTLLRAEEILNVGPQSLSLNVSRDDAINVLKNSSKTDLKGDIIKDWALEKAEPRIIVPDWMMQLGHIGGYDHLYITRNNVSQPRLCWLITYVSDVGMHGGNTGRYLVDAEKGELVLAVEDHPMCYPLFKVTEPEKVTLIQGMSTTFNVTVSPKPTFDAILPATLSPDRIPEGVSVSFDSDRKPVSNEFPADFTVTLRASPETLPGTYFTVIKVSGPGFSTSAHFDLEIKPS